MLDRVGVERLILLIGPPYPRVLPSAS
jgi:hypothetical protein